MYLRISQANMQVFPTFPEAEWANIKPIRSRSHARWARSITTLVPIWHLGTWLQCGRGLAVGWKGVASWVVLWDALWLKEKGHQGAPLICAIWEGDFFFCRGSINFEEFPDYIHKRSGNTVDGKNRAPLRMPENVLILG